MSSESTAITALEPADSTVRSSVGFGWVMVGVAAVAMVATLPGRTHGLGMITERLLADPTLGLTRSGYGQMNLWATLLGSLFCLGIGSCIDCYGIRRTLAVVMGVLGCVVVMMSQMASFWALFVAILLTRGFGQSALSVVSISIVGKWFDRNVSLPMAVYSVLMAGGFVLAALAGRQYADADWRVFWSGIGWTVLGLTVLLYLIARDRRPLPTQTKTESGSPDEAIDIGFTPAQALRTPMFWVCSLGISLYGMIVSGISLFNESILVDQGFRKEVYYESLALGSAVGVCSKLLAGLMGVYLPVNRLLSLALVLLGGSLVWLTQLKTYGDVVGYVTVNAVAGGMLTVLFFSAWPDLYGRTHLGKIQGLAQMMTVIASAFGPLIFAQVREATGSYQPLLWVLAGCVLATAAVAWLTRLPTLPKDSIEDQ